MMENAYYSVISPEGCATILWKGAEHAPRAAEALRMTARDLLRLGVIDEVVPEPPGGAHRNHREAAANLKAYLIRSLRELAEQPRAELLARRYEKFRRMGVFEETLTPALAPQTVGDIAG
jgi:acetyl-CoA carboxylase carboxyl transferase subunit alpha